MASRPRAGGFTLIEVLVAFTLAAVLLAAVLQAVSGALRSHHAGEAYTRAALAAESMLAEAVLGAGGERALEGDLARDPGYRYRIREEPYPGDSLGSVEGLPIAAWQVTVEVLFDLPGGPGRISLTTLALRPELP
jgi:general secretion pathway protein I